VSGHHPNRALELHGKYGSNERIVRHCEAVARVALVLTEALKRSGKQVDERSVMIAALLHDIGRTRIQTVHHGYFGAEIAEKEGLGGAVSGMIRRHVGAGISKEEAAKLGFPDGDYIPRTLEERIVCFSDKMVDGERVRPLEEEVRRFIAKGHDVQRLRRLSESLREDLGEDPERLILSELRG
jgi:uncharacterized protein (TIGR00295 family)